MDNKLIKGLLNPIRMKIIMVLLKEKQATKKVISEEMKDIPQASLYRHLNHLVQEGILIIKEENQIRGTYERVYELSYNPFESMNQIGLSKDYDKLIQFYYTFVMTQLLEFSEYVSNKDSDLEKDKVGFRSYPLYLSEVEKDDFLNDFGQLLKKYINNKSTDENRMHKFSFAFMPVE